MKEDSSLMPWQRLAGASSMIDVLMAQEGIDGEALITDLTPMVGTAAPDWVEQLPLPQGWELKHLPTEQSGVVTRVAVAGPRADSGWEAVETLSAFAYTGYASFHDIADNAASTLRDLGASGITSRVLPVPPVRWTVAVRADGMVNFAARQVFIRQSNYLAGSEQSHAGRLTIHSVMVDAAALPRYAGDVELLSDAVHERFVAALVAP